MTLIIPESRFEMPALLTPGRQPLGPVAVDWANPLTRGMFFCTFPESRQDIALKKHQIVPNNGGFVRNTKNGRGWASDGTSLMRWQTNGNFNDISGLQRLSVAFGVTINSLSPVPAFFGKWSATANPGGLVSTIESSGIGVIIAPDSQSYNWVGKRTSSVSAGSYQDVLMTWGGGGGMNLWRNGVYDTISWLTGAPSSVQNVSEKLYICSHGDANTAGNITIQYLIMWNRELGATEARSFQRNPYQFLIPA